MPEIDDFFVMSNVSKIDLNKAIDKYKHSKKFSIPEDYLKTHFSALLQDNDNKTLFKKNEIANSPLQEFWTLRFIEIAENNNDNISINKSSPLDKNDLKEIVNICFFDDRINKVREYLKKRGIYLYFIDFLPGTNIDGAVYLTSRSTIAVGLTVRFERLDHLWFTLLHELAHIISHYQLLSEGIISTGDTQDSKEVEANRFAKEAIISPEKYRVCLPRKTLKSEDLLKYSKENNVHPALLAGIIRKDLNCYHIFNNIISEYIIKRSYLYD